ncbi:hypothetical protein [Yersinia sp. 1652 StPb PI]|uniref:hypothetical protein n=1 Tax=unclassified Yersinia (in: enterobacteria) TaxID=2653513 RepID=UPI00355B1640
MSTLYTINVINNSPTAQDFFFFQKPAIYTGGAKVYSNSIYQEVLSPFASSGSVLTFECLMQFYAGAQSQLPSLLVGQDSGYITSSQPVDLTSITAGVQTANTTVMSVDPSLGLSPATYTEGVQPGAYRIVTPAFNPVTDVFNAGLAVQSASGSSVLSSFINAEPSKNIDCQPVLSFYVQTGTYQAGTVINFSTSSVGSAICDTTQGVTAFNVIYNPQGTWTVSAA